jgi:F-type H+-transporting ATPase subunit b
MEGLGINLPLLVAFVINFLILFGLLTLVLYKPVLRVLDERQAKITDSIEQAERIKEQTAHSEEEIRTHLETARKEGQAVIAQATQIGDRVKEEATEKARQEAENIVLKSQSEIRQERDKLVDDLRKEFVDIAILAAEKVTKETLDKQKHQKLLDEVLKESTTFKRK